MEKFRGQPPEGHLREKEATESHWEHPCTSCSHEGSTTFMEGGGQKKMDVYSCSSHTQPGIYGMAGTEQSGDRIVVRYGEPTDSSKGEISYTKDQLDLDELRKRAKHRGKSNFTAAELAVGKIM